MLRAAGRTTFAVVCHDHNFKLGKYVVGEFDDGVDAADADDDRSPMPERSLDCIRKAVWSMCCSYVSLRHLVTCHSLCTNTSPILQGKSLRWHW